MKFPKLMMTMATIIISTSSFAELMNYQLSTYAVVKPNTISTSVSIGSGVVHKVYKRIGDMVNSKSALIEILEENTLRSYRSTINGQVVKVHVTQSAAVSPGMPLITVMDPDKKYLEILLSPTEAKFVTKGNQVLDAKSGHKLGILDFVSSLVDPDNGGVAARAIIPDLKQRVGEVMNIKIAVADLQCSKVLNIKDFTNTDKPNVKVIYDEKVCLE